jgi:hypothetical protein
VAIFPARIRFTDRRMRHTSSIYAWIAPSSAQRVAGHHYGALISIRSTFIAYSRPSLTLSAPIT